MKTKPLLSILIPTKNREEFALKVIFHILAIPDSRLQLVIQNNSDTNELENSLAEAMNDPRLKYLYNNAILSFVDNFSLGLSQCDGEYVTIIGDDDGVNPLIFDIVEWASTNSIEAITPSLSIVYFWPESVGNLENAHGRLTISDFTCKTRYFDAANEVIKLLKNGCQNYLAYSLAKVYHGVVKKSVLDEVKNRTGKYIGGLSPDIYLSIATSLLVKKAIIIDYPLTISGICKKSGSADYATGKHTGSIDQAPHFRGHLNYEWSDKVPEFYSGETIWGDSALAAVKDLKYNHLMEYFSVDIISAYCIKLYPQFKTLILQNLAESHRIKHGSMAINFFLLGGFIKGPLRTYLKAIANQIFNKRSQKRFDDVQDIGRAAELVQENIRNSNSSILGNLKVQTNFS